MGTAKLRTAGFVFVATIDSCGFFTLNWGLPLFLIEQRQTIGIILRR
jgi:hypothetical protein